ncbi:MAG: dienelactone hydrolase family protein [Endozoicomonas sp.]
MNRIVVTDIFGKTPALESLCQELPGTSQIVDPYQGRFRNFSSEAQAYACFTSEVGLPRYAEALHDQVSGQNGKVELIGFSVGASAIWLLSERFTAEKVTGATCFYGSQIRHSIHLSPRFPVHLILPASEQHFSVQELANSLERKQNVEIEHTPYLHGFMNRYSENFNETAYRHFIQWLSPTVLTPC